MAGFLTWLVGYPLLITLMEAVGLPAAVTLEHFLDFARRPDEWRALWQSLWISIASTVLAAVVGVPDPVRTEAIKAFIVPNPGHAADEALTVLEAFLADSEGSWYAHLSRGWHRYRWGGVENALEDFAAAEAVSGEALEEHLYRGHKGCPHCSIEEIAAMVAWLVSAENSFTTGAVFDLSGGRATY